MIQKIKILLSTLVLAGTLSIGLCSISVLADDPPPCKSGYANPLNSKGDPLPGCAKIKTAADCPSGVPGMTVNGKKDVTKCEPLGTNPVALKDNPIVGDLNTIVNVLAALVGVVVVGTIILGGVQFAAAGDKAERVSAAKQRIINGLTALAAFLFVYAFLQWLVPGGIFQ